MLALSVILSHVCDPMGCSPPGYSVPGIFPGKNTGVGCCFLLQGLNWHLLHLPLWQADSFPLCHLGSPTPKLVVLNPGSLWPPGDIRHCPQTCWLSLLGQERSTIGNTEDLWGTGARDGVNHPYNAQDSPLQQRITWPKMSTWLRLGTPDLYDHTLYSGL